MFTIFKICAYLPVNTFLNNGCTGTLFLETFDVSVICNTDCDNANLTMIYPYVYIYNQ